MAENRTPDDFMAYVAQYQSAKAALRDAANEAKRATPNDKPAIRQAINDYADMLIKDLPASMSDNDKAIFADQLSFVACTLHPKD